MTAESGRTKLIVIVGKGICALVAAIGAYIITIKGLAILSTSIGADRPIGGAIAYLVALLSPFGIGAFLLLAIGVLFYWMMGKLFGPRL